MDNTVDILERAHNISGNSMKIIAKNRNQECACFHCKAIFSAEECILELKDNSATCPYCHMDTLLPEDAGFPLTESFISQMHNRYFALPEYTKNPCDPQAFLRDFAALTRRDARGVMNAVARQGCKLCKHVPTCCAVNENDAKRDFRCDFEVDTALFSKALQTGIEAVQSNGK